MNESVVTDDNVPIVLYDGDCHICNASIQFILRHERNNKLKFASLSAIPSSISDNGLSTIGKSDAIHFVYNKEVYIESDAVVRIASYLKPPYSWLGIIRFIPRSIRNYVYRFIARNRHKLQSMVSNKCDLYSEYADRLI
jgi:predicted DCC family thiol-disulfide oxidoreductase YuxK